MGRDQSVRRGSCSHNEPFQCRFGHFTSHVNFTVPPLDGDRRHFRSEIHFDGRGLADAGHVRGGHGLSTAIVSRLEKVRRRRIELVEILDPTIGVVPVVVGRIHSNGLPLLLIGEERFEIFVVRRRLDETRGGTGFECDRHGESEYLFYVGRR